MFVHFLMLFSSFSRRRKATPDFLDKKHLNFDQGLDFLIFYQGNRGVNQEKPKENQEKLRKTTKIEEKTS